MLQEYRDGFRPAEKLGVGASICFMCEDALKIHHETASRGLQPEEPFVGNAMWVVPFTDPDGYGICFESPTDVPEGTKYGEWTR